MSRLLGLDIDSRYLRMSLAEERFKRITYIRSEGVELPPDAEARNKTISEALQKWKGLYSPDGVILGLPLQVISSRLVQMPAMSRDDMVRALPFEMEKHLPLAVDEYLIDFIMSRSESGSQPLVFSVKKELVMSILKIVSDAGLPVKSVRCRTVDVFNSLLGITGDKKMSGIFVLKTDEAYEIIAVSDSIPVSMKRMPVDQDISGILHELKLSYPGKIYASGSLDQRIFDQFGAIKSDITVANALIYSYVHRSKNGLDFLPGELKKSEKDFYPMIVGGLAVASFIIYILAGAVTYVKDATTLGRIESRIAELKGKASGVIEARKKLESLQDDRNTLADFRGRSNLAVRVMKDLTAVVPQDSWIINLNIDDKGIIEAEGFSRKTSDLITALDKSKKFKNISFAAPIISRDGEERFSLKFEVKEP